MTEKRFTINMEYECIDDAKREIFIDFNDRIDFYELCEFLNKLVDENEQLKKQLMENNCDNCIYSKAIYADVECRKKGLTEWKYNCDEFKGDVE